MQPGVADSAAGAFVDCWRQEDELRAATFRLKISEGSSESEKGHLNQKESSIGNGRPDARLDAWLIAVKVIDEQRKQSPRERLRRERSYLHFS